MKTFAAFVAGLLVVASSAVTAQSINFDLTGSGGEGTTGNTLVFTNSSLTVKATGWGYTSGSSDNAFEKAAIGQWNVGMGVRNAGETTSNEDHQVDNVGPEDWVLFTFSEKVDISGVRIDPYGVYDRDVTYWVGNITPGLNLSGKTYADLAALGFSSETLDLSTASESARTVSIVGNGVNAILIGGRRGEFSDSDADRFKITGITAERFSAVPEPSGLLLGAIGMITLLARRRRCC